MVRFGQARRVLALLFVLVVCPRQKSLFRGFLSIVFVELFLMLKGIPFTVSSTARKQFLRIIAAPQSLQWFLRFFMLDRLSHQAIRLNNWSEFPGPPL